MSALGVHTTSVLLSPLILCNGTGMLSKKSAFLVEAAVSHPACLFDEKSIINSDPNTLHSTALCSGNKQSGDDVYCSLVDTLVPVHTQRDWQGRASITDWM
ncbi:hypothetical protein J6590_015119 [Homalodisca vitripennis]|nr:hypothetical protein J6590_015119 [Homalodisca vitripennis]